MTAQTSKVKAWQYREYPGEGERLNLYILSPLPCLLCSSDRCITIKMWFHRSWIPFSEIAPSACSAIEIKKWAKLSSATMAFKSADIIWGWLPGVRYAGLCMGYTVITILIWDVYCDLKFGILVWQHHKEWHDCHTVATGHRHPYAHLTRLVGWLIEITIRQICSRHLTLNWLKNYKKTVLARYTDSNQTLFPQCWFNNLTGLAVSTQVNHTADKWCNK